MIGAVAVIVAPVVVTAILSDAPWLPPERIKVAGEALPSVGYIVGDSEGWTTILKQDTRLLNRVRSTTIESRTVCTLPGRENGVRTIWRVFAPDPATYPTCA